MGISNGQHGFMSVATVYLIAIVADEFKFVLGSLVLLFLFDGRDNAPRGSTCANHIFVGHAQQVSFFHRQFHVHRCHLLHRLHHFCMIKHDDYQLGQSRISSASLTLDTELYKRFLSPPYPTQPDKPLPTNPKPDFEESRINSGPGRKHAQPPPPPLLLQPPPPPTHPWTPVLVVI